MSTIVVFPDKAVLHYNVSLLDGLTISFLILTCVTLALRVWVRVKMISCWGKDDWTIVLAQAFFISTCGLTLKWINYQKNASSSQSYRSFAQSYDDLFIQEVTFLATVILLKISLAAFFLRFLVERWARLVIWSGTILFTVWTIALAFVLIFYCGSPNHIMEKALQGKCIQGSTVFVLGIVWGSFNAATDWMFALLPIFFVLRSRITKTAKISVVVVMTIAVVGSGAAIARLVYYKYLESAYNYWAVGSQFLAWSIVEPGIGIFAANLATLRPLLSSISGRTSSTLSSPLFTSAGEDNTGDETKNVVKHVGRKPSSNSDQATLVVGFEKRVSQLDFVTAKIFDDDIDRVERGGV